MSLDLDLLIIKLYNLHVQYPREVDWSKRIIMLVYVNLKVCGLIVDTSNWIDNRTIGSDLGIISFG